MRKSHRDQFRENTGRSAVLRCGAGFTSWRDEATA
jgi:hypothetical protein